jgi:hypothetical protein
VLEYNQCLRNIANDATNPQSEEAQQIVVSIMEFIREKYPVVYGAISMASNASSMLGLLGVLLKHGADHVKAQGQSTHPNEIIKSLGIKL